MNGRKWMNLLAVLSVGPCMRNQFCHSKFYSQKCGSATGKSAEKCCEVERLPMKANFLYLGFGSSCRYYGRNCNRYGRSLFSCIAEK